MSKGTTTTTQEAQVPEYLQSLFTEYAQRAKEASDIPFVGYTGDRIAGLSPEEAQAQAAAQGLFGTAFGFDPTAQLQTLAGQAIPTAADVPSLLAGALQISKDSRHKMWPCVRARLVVPEVLFTSKKH